jgi:hypothetical protein
MLSILKICLIVGAVTILFIALDIIAMLRGAHGVKFTDDDFEDFDE